MQAVVRGPVTITAQNRPRMAPVQRPVRLVVAVWRARDRLVRTGRPLLDIRRADPITVNAMTPQASGMSPPRGSPCAEKALPLSVTPIPPDWPKNPYVATRPRVGRWSAARLRHPLRAWKR